MATLKKVMTLLGKAGIKDDLRRDMVYEFTSGRTESVRNLSDRELRMFCEQLEAKNRASEIEIEMRRKRSIVLTIATRTGIKEPNNWAKFNLWMQKSSVFKKDLNFYDYDELDLLIRQFRGIEANYTKSSGKAGTKAWYHATGIPHPNSN